MEQLTVAQFAAELGLPTTLMLHQLKSAGVTKNNSYDQISNEDKSTLLEYLRREHGAAAEPENQINLSRKHNTDNKPTVAKFAAELGLPSKLLIEQLKSAGVVKSNLEDILYESDKEALLEYLRREHGAAAEPENQINLTRKQNTGKPELKRDEISKYEIQRLMHEIYSLDELRNEYFMMTVFELEELYQAGKNELLDEAENKMIRAALREKKQIKI